MKKIKLLTTLTSLGALSATVPVIATSCSQGEYIDITPYYEVSEDATKLYKVTGLLKGDEEKEKEEEKNYRKEYVRDLTENDIIVTADDIAITWQQVIQDLPTDNDNEYNIILDGDTAYDGITKLITSFPKNITFLGTKNTRVDGFKFKKSDASSIMPEKVIFDGVKFYNDVTTEKGSNATAWTTLKEFAVINCEFKYNEDGIGDADHPRAAILGKGSSANLETLRIENCVFEKVTNAISGAQNPAAQIYWTSCLISKNFIVKDSVFEESRYNTIQQNQMAANVTIENNVFKNIHDRIARVVLDKTEEQTKYEGTITIKNNKCEYCCDDYTEGGDHYKQLFYFDGLATKEVFDKGDFSDNQELEKYETVYKPVVAEYYDNAKIILHDDTYLVNGSTKNGSSTKILYQGTQLKYNSGSGTPSTGFENMSGNVELNFELTKPTWGEDLTSGITWVVSEQISSVWTPIVSSTTHAWLTWAKSTNNKLQLKIATTVGTLANTKFKVEAVYVSPTHKPKVRSLYFELQTENK
ncbi:MAG: hypothetical protein HUJ52_01810 [Malacoplasma sp.]|nr:hypothetical protein [Malacoplasma sp.]